MDRGGFQAACERRGVAAAAARHRCGGQLRRRVAGRLRDDVRRVQLDGTKALFDGCVRAGVKRVIHISAIGAEPDGPSAFSRSKAAAEAYLKELPLDWVILRPALVLGPAVYGGTAMLRGIAAFPGVAAWAFSAGAAPRARPRWRSSLPA